MSALSMLPSDREKLGSDLIAPDCRGLNFWTLDPSLRDLLALNLD
jgi:acyl-CoA dehydrogenase